MRKESSWLPTPRPLLVARRTTDERLFPIFEEHSDLDLEPAFDETLEPIYDDEDGHLDYPAYGPLLVTRRTLSIQPKTNEREQRENLFHSRCLVSEKVCSLIIDGGSCTNVASESLVRKLRLVTKPHPRPFRLEWLNDTGEQYIREQVAVPLTIGRYEDEVLSNVLPMDACHILLGRPWQFDKKTIHDGYTNRHSFDHKGKKITIVPLAPAEVHQDQLQLKKSRDKEPKWYHSNYPKECYSHQKRSSYST